LSDLKPYEEELAKRLKELSLPNKELVWEKIEKLLDKDDDGTIIPPPLRWNNNLWAVLIFSFLIIGSAIVYSHYSFKKTNINQKDNKDEVITAKKYTDKPTAQLQSAFTKNSTNSRVLPGYKKVSGLTNEGNTKSKEYIFRRISCRLSQRSKVTYSAIDSTTDNTATAKEEGSAKKDLAISTKAKTKSHITNADAESEPVGQDNLNKELPLTYTSRNASSQKNQTVPLSDSVVKKDTSIIKPSINAAQDSSIAARKKNSNRKKKFYLAAGVAVQQPVRLNYDLVYPSDDYTMTSSVTDYLPSVYVRLYNQKKWFIQSEFKYAAPQNIEEFIYKVDVQNEPFKDIVTSYTLKKVYVNQLSASFHYFILSNWSIGSGIIYNIFSGADIQKDVHQKHYESANDSLLGSVSLTDKNDSNFSSHIKNNFQWLLETQYKWKHISIGLRYAIGLQPYIHYIDPFSGLPAQQNNNSLNVFIRYELWRSKQK